MRSLWAHHIRAIRTRLPLIAQTRPEFKNEYDVWKKFSNKQNTPATEDEFTKQIAVMLKVIELLKPKLAKLG